jgi:hypothetical protein
MKTKLQLLTEIMRYALSIGCPSCGALPNECCRRKRDGKPAPMHQRRLSTYVAGNIREK